MECHDRHNALVSPKVVCAVAPLDVPDLCRRVAAARRHQGARAVGSVSASESAQNKRKKKAACFTGCTAVEVSNTLYDSAGDGNPGVGLTEKERGWGMGMGAETRVYLLRQR